MPCRNCASVILVMPTATGSRRSARANSFRHRGTSRQIAFVPAEGFEVGVDAAAQSTAFRPSLKPQQSLGEVVEVADREAGKRELFDTPSVGWQGQLPQRSASFTTISGNSCSGL